MIETFTAPVQLSVFETVVERVSAPLAVNEYAADLSFAGLTFSESVFALKRVTTTGRTKSAAHRTASEKTGNAR
jgi:hypothetical protein